MKISRIQIEQEFAQLKIETQMASLSIEMPKRRMSIQQQPAQMNIKQQKPNIELDMQEFRNNIGLKSNKALMEEYVAEAQARAQQGIRQMAKDGDFVGTLPTDANNIGELARAKLLQVSEPEMNSGKVPPGAISMDGKPGNVDINWMRHDLKIDWDEYQAPKITVEPKASVHIEIAREPVLEITVIEETIPPETGRAIDTEA
ncbi:MAG TPA: hypothetical protein GXZ52_02300 [Clostridiales bacterium]|nr:hypothetical protein [Clostridiales bacterium]